MDLDAVPKKYQGLDGTELAISESQERMAVVVAPEDVDTFLRYAAQENLEATRVAVVTEEPRLVLNWRGKAIVNLSRAFLDTNGAHQETDVYVEMPSEQENYFRGYAAAAVQNALEDGKTEEAFRRVLSDLNVASQKGLVEQFDSSIGAGSVLLPFGGRYQLTPAQVMVAKFPVQKGTSHAVSMMAYGFDPYLSSWSPYHGAVYAVTESVARIVATGPSRSISGVCRTTRSAGASPLPRCWAVMRHSLGSACRRLAARIRCRARSMTSMYRRRWYPLR